MNTDEGALMTLTQAADYLGLSRSWLYKSVACGEFPVRPRCIGTRRMFSRAELDRWLSTPQPENANS